MSDKINDNLNESSWSEIYNDIESMEMTFRLDEFDKLILYHALFITQVKRLFGEDVTPKDLSETLDKIGVGK